MKQSSSHRQWKDMTGQMCRQEAEGWLPPLLPIQPLGSQLPFFCIGAGPFFRPLARHLAHFGHPLFGVELSDRHQIPPPYRMDTIAGYLVRAIRARQPNGPYLIGGWCLHGIVAYEVACQLRQQGDDVEMLILFDTPHPSYWQGRSFEPERVKYHLARIFQLRPKAAWNYARLRLQAARFRIRTRIWKWAYRIGRSRGTHVWSWLRDSQQMMVYASSQYTPEAVPGVVCLVRGTDRLPGFETDPAFGWSELLGERLRIEEVQGNHYTMFQEPNVATLAQRLANCLEQTESMTAASAVEKPFACGDSGSAIPGRSRFHDQTA